MWFKCSQITLKSEIFGAILQSSYREEAFGPTADLCKADHTKM